MALEVEGIVDGGVDAEKMLGGANRLEALHFALSPGCATASEQPANLTVPAGNCARICDHNQRMTPLRTLASRTSVYPRSEALPIRGATY